MSGISVRYRRRQALEEVDLCLAPGVTALLGPNGAGKSTLLSVLATARRPSSGSVRVLGSTPDSEATLDRVRREIGYLPQRFDLMGRDTCLANVRYAAWAHGVDADAAEHAAWEALGVADLTDLAHVKVRQLSGGQRQRVGIACAVAHRPRLLLLDEPTAGLDPVQRASICDQLRAIGAEMTVVMCTHLVADVADLADHIVVLVAGRIACQHDARSFAAVSPDLESTYRACLLGHVGGSE